MGEFIFALKTLVFTTILVTLMQFQISGQKIEDMYLNFASNSGLIQNLEQVALGGIELTKNTYKSVAAHFGVYNANDVEVFEEKAVGRRSILPEFKRSDSVLQKMRDSASVENSVDKAKDTIIDAKNKLEENTEEMMDALNE